MVDSGHALGRLPHRVGLDTVVPLSPPSSALDLQSVPGALRPTRASPQEREPIRSSGNGMAWVPLRMTGGTILASTQRDWRRLPPEEQSTT